MNREIKVEYCFEKNAKVLERDSEELVAYAKHFEKDVLPEIVEIERKKASAREFAYQLRVSGFCAISPR
ncbi:MAG: hypothetical protein U5R49_06585 [Deltaproteobacteria bacterium]|nr:hypothetical protein [Deltaproteobacteria bacterium]